MSWHDNAVLMRRCGKRRRLSFHGRFLTEECFEAGLFKILIVSKSLPYPVFLHHHNSGSCLPGCAVKIMIVLRGRVAGRVWIRGKLVRQRGQRDQWS